jgi:hypothetical protein
MYFALSKILEEKIYFLWFILTFPLPVWPYAKIVLLKPSKTDSVQLFTTLYTSTCVELGPNTESNAHLNDFFPSREVTLNDFLFRISTADWFSPESSSA